MSDYKPETIEIPVDNLGKELHLDKTVIRYYSQYERTEIEHITHRANLGNMLAQEEISEKLVKYITYLLNNPKEIDLDIKMYIKKQYYGINYYE